ncbi:uncharacterized protein BCR38DRAFT_410384 [Pseudomassariella vexata]|uniref:Rhodopsin domain-containing protein n=1 Tax=Pseudomassariella vexata TaxID=1141098 RepID=A0A1Y2DWF0_9PEZI|nr:uncharacterized protein BCR38DRAFT_410384 [Pseudomassariella vexata]ORY63466.1 hypothetical protein BCR38DRAFT_410384 [Pseudomassariella vexata]
MTRTKSSVQADIVVLMVPCSTWNIIEPSIGIVCACLPTMQPLPRIILGGLLMISGKIKDGQDDFDTIKTISQVSVRPSYRKRLSRMKGDNGTGLFGRLKDRELSRAMAGDLWPNEDHNERNYNARGQHAPSEQSVEVPLEPISRRHTATK